MITAFARLSLPRDRLHLFRHSANTRLLSPIRFQARLQVQLDRQRTAVHPHHHGVSDHAPHRPRTKTSSRQATLSARVSFSKAMSSAGSTRHCKRLGMNHPRLTGSATSIKCWVSARRRRSTSLVWRNLQRSSKSCGNSALVATPWCTSYVRC